MKRFNDMSSLDRIRAIRVGAIVTVPKWMKVKGIVKGVIEYVNGAYIGVRLNNGVLVEPYENELMNFYGWASGSQPDFFKEYTNA